MNRPSLSTFRAQWPADAMGICIVDPQVGNYCNAAQERLLMDPMTPDEGWWGGWVTLNLSVAVSNGAAYITTPREIARLVVMGVCQQPIRIRNGFYEYLQFGSGLQPKTCRTGSCGSTFEAYERDNVVTFSDLLPTPQTIRIYPTNIKDIGLRVLLQGKDQNGKVILTTDPNTTLTAPGEYLMLAFPFVDSVNQFSEINGIQKDETYGTLQFFQVDPSTGTEADLSTMEPNESSANYRRYLINGIPSTNLCCSSTGNPITVTAQGRVDFVPVVNETDYLTLPCVPALIEESMSIRFGKWGTSAGSDESLIHHLKAISLLNGQLDAYEGKVSTAIRMPIFGSQPMRRQPV